MDGQNGFQIVSRFWDVSQVVVLVLQSWSLLLNFKNVFLRVLGECIFKRRTFFCGSLLAPQQEEALSRRRKNQMDPVNSIPIACHKIPPLSCSLGGERTWYTFVNYLQERSWPEVTGLEEGSLDRKITERQTATLHCRVGHRITLVILSGLKQENKGRTRESYACQSPVEVGFILWRMEPEFRFPDKLPIPARPVRVCFTSE